MQENNMIKGNLILITMFAVLLMLMSVVNVNAASQRESEPNDTKSAANLIKMGMPVYGSTPIKNMGVYDQNYDWFRFTAPISGTAKLYVHTDGFTKDESDGLSVYVYDSNDNKLTSTFDPYSTTSGNSVTFPVKSGKTYFLHCYGSDDVIGIFKNVDYHIQVDYEISKTKITKVKAGKKQFTVTWSKQSKASFYQVQYIKKSVYDDYGWSKAKTVNASNKSKSKKIKGLAKKKQYYVRVRVARTIDGVTYYSVWSPRKLVKTK